MKFDQGATGLGLALRQLPVEGTVLYVTAHPDDENNGVLVALNRGRGLKTSLLTVTRGDGGQNEIGPELFRAIGILRSEELMGVHKYDGADQYHTRAFEFGYSFSVEETFQKWGKEILRDVVRVVRSVRPDVILTMNRDGSGGGQHHRDPRGSRMKPSEPRRPGAVPRANQGRPGPWQPRKVYQAGGGPVAVAAPERRSLRLVRRPRRRFACRPASTTRCSACRGRSSARWRAHAQVPGHRTSKRFRGQAGAYAIYDSEPRVSAGERHPRRRRLRSDESPSSRLEKNRRSDAVFGLAAIDAAAREALNSFDARTPQKSLPRCARADQHSPTP